MTSWAAFHLHYHEDRDLAVREGLQPAVAELLAEGSADRFFFIRYGLGGPHVRLRLRFADGGAEAVDRVVRRHVGHFLASRPSCRAAPEDEVRATTEALIADDPFGDPTLRPDNVLVAQDFVPETGRYGGAERLEHSLDFFQSSSLEAMRWLTVTSEITAGKRLSHGFRLLVRQALGFSSTLNQVEAILGYVSGLWGSGSSVLRERAETAFANQHDAFRGMLDAEFAAVLLDDAEPPPLVAASHRLAAAVADAPEAVRFRLLTSQVHMTANRLGLNNPEEAYLGHLALLALRDRAGSDLLASAVEALGQTAREDRPTRLVDCFVPPWLAAITQTAV